MNIENLHKSWLELGEKYFENEPYINFVWDNLKKNYCSKNRYYHNFKHIQSMIEKAEEDVNYIKDFDEILFAIWFHDIVYKSSSKNNEEKKC